jgi:hypothetical protein
MTKHRTKLQKKCGIVFFHAHVSIRLARAGLINKSTLSYTMLSVASGSYPIYVGYSFTAGPDEASGSITVNITSP